jgi:hypothetical protein
MRKTDCIETENERRAFQSLKEKESLWNNERGNGKRK